MILPIPGRVEHLWWLTVAATAALAAATFLASLFDGRALGGTGVWAKPLKFSLATALHFATVALVFGALGERMRESTLLWWVAVAAVASTAYELGYITLQAARGDTSHFNVRTPVYEALYSAMAACAVVITVTAAVVGVAALLDGEARLGPATRLGVGLGLIGGTVLTLVVAFRLGGAMTHHVGIEPQGAPRMPLTGWSLAVGDRRVPHFFALHMMQAVPLAGLVLDLLLPRAAAMAGVSIVAALWAALTVFLFQGANAGVPFLRWS